MIQYLFLIASALSLPDSPGDTLRSQQLEEVVVTKNTARQRLQNVQVGAEQLQLKELTAAPSLMGEADIMRSIQMLPGVKAESDASSSFQVRGGTSGQNVILYDDAPVYNVGHLAGFLSSFNEDVLGSATLYKGMLPAQFGGASSAVLDISSRAGNMERWKGGVTVGLLSAKANIEGPIKTEKASLLFCARRSYADMFLKLSDKYKNNSLYFYDTNLRLDYQLNQKNKLQLSFFASNDKVALKEMLSLRWTNVAGSLSWLHQMGETSTSQTSLFTSNYSTDNGVDMLGTDLTFSGHIRQTGLRQHFAIVLGAHELQIGGLSMLSDVKTAEWRHVKRSESEQRKSWENSVWAGILLKLAPTLSLQGGLRFSAYSSLGGPYYYEVDDQGNISWFYKTRSNRIVYTHYTFDPRISMNWQLQELVSIKAGYARTSQNLHALRGQNTSTPFDRYIPSSNLLKPELADHFSVGVFAMTPQQDYDFSIEGYYRHISNILDYRDGKSFGSEIEMERLVLPGEGRGYGVEITARKNTGRLRGWLYYALSWSENKIPHINGGEWYTASNDRRHDIGIVGQYQLSPAWMLGALWTYNSGQAFTAPSGKYEIIDNYIYYYAERNGYRAPAYHRLDVSATWTAPIFNGRMKRELSFGIYNLYNRYNPYLINFEDSENGARTKATQYSLFGIVPNVSLTIKF